jgi:hypothetical protein
MTFTLCEATLSSRTISPLLPSPYLYCTHNTEVCCHTVDRQTNDTQTAGQERISAEQVLAASIITDWNLGFLQ